MHPRESWRPLSLWTAARLEAHGWTWCADPRAGPAGRALRSPRGKIFEVRFNPLRARPYEERRFLDAA